MSTKVIPLGLGMSEAFLLQGEGLVLVDTGMNVEPGRFAEIFKELKVNPQDIRLIVITHGHIDHFVHAAELKELTGAKILCHEKAVPYLKSGNSAPVRARNLLGSFLKMLIGENSPKDYRPVEADIVIDGECSLKEYGVDAEIIHTPGHCDCSISIIVNGSEVLCGDTILFSSFFNRKRPGAAIFSVNDRQLFESVVKLADLNGEIYYSAHGGPFTGESVRKLAKKYRK